MSKKTRKKYVSTVKGFVAEKIILPTIGLFLGFIKSTKNGKRYLAIPLPKPRTVKIVLLALVAVSLIVFLAWRAYRFLGPQDYRISSANSILAPTSDVIANSIKYDEKEKLYSYEHGLANGSETRQTGATLAGAKIPVNAKKGLTVSDPNYATDLTITPQFPLAEAKQDKNRFIYPMRDQRGWLVYTAQGTGVKEDIILKHKAGDTFEVSYNLKLPNGTVAKLETDGSVGIYGNSVFVNSVTAATEADQELLQKAQQVAEKNLLLFTIPKPIVVESNRSASNVKASFKLNGSTLTLSASRLEQASYPLSIDPSIYIVTAQQFMNGNNETNIDFDVDNKLIKKAPTTGARFDEWNSTMSMNTTRWRQGVAVAGGYIYTVGGVHPEGGAVTFSTAGSDTFTVPSGITSVTIKAWGAGGGGGGGGDGSPGGNGGAGGYSTTTINVTPNETLNVTVGGGGGGGTAGGNSGGGGGGGGHSVVRRGSTNLIIAGGGGGGGGGGNNSANTGGAGGGGGGVSGESGNASGTSGGGGGGSNSSGGGGGTGSTNRGSAGSYLQGGDGGDGRSSTSGADGGANNGGSNGGGSGGARDVSNRYAGAGGGGSGYYGGGGGTGSTSRTGAGAGGGGSSYTTPSGSGSNTEAASGTTPGNSSDPDRASAGNAGTGAAVRQAGSSGSNGFILISYVSDTGATDTVEWARFNTADGSLESTNPGAGVCSGWCTSTQYNLPAPRGKLSLVAYNGFLYAIGGEDASCTAANGTGDNGVCNTVYIAKLGANGEPQMWHPTDSNKSNWTYWYRDSNLSSPRSGIKAVAYSNRLYLMGGITSSSGSLSIANTTQIADLTPNGRLGAWSSSTTLPYAAYGYTSLAYNDRLYLIGGASSIGGQPLASVYYNKINADGSLNSWQQTTSMPSGRMSSGGDFSAVWGAYIYVSGGCSQNNANGYCTTISSDSQLSSINADGSIDVWNTLGGVSDTRTGHSVVGWRGYIYIIGGCSDQNAANGTCNSPLSSIKLGKINPDGEASTVADSVSRGTDPCSGSDPQQCDLPGVSYVGNVLNGSAILNGYLYIWGGCNNTNSGCSSVSRGVMYTAIDSNGHLKLPASCGSWSSIDNYCYNATSLPETNGVGAPASAVANGYLYSVGGFTSNGMVGDIYYAKPDPVSGVINSWSSNTLSSVGAESVSYSYAFTRANPTQATTDPNNLYILGGCTNATGIGCPANSSGYTDSVFKCNLSPTGVPSGCSQNNQLQIGTIPGANSAGLGAMAGTVYANYIYLMGGLTNGLNDLKTTRYAKIDDNNNIVAVSGNGWVESDKLNSFGRRRGSGFGYNGYLYVIGGYDGTGGGGVLADIEFAKINVSDGSLEDWTVSTVNINQRWGLGLTVSNSYAYVIGGCTSGNAPTCASGGQTNSIQTFQIYNNDSGAPAGYSQSVNTFTTDSQRVGASATIHNGRLYIAGGCTSAMTDCDAATNNVSYASIDANGNIGKWTSTSAGLPSARTWGKLVSVANTLYYIGGQSSNQTDERAEVYYATPIGTGNISSWSTASNSLPSARTKLGATVWNNRIYVLGGLDNNTTPSASLYVSPLLNSGGNISSPWSTSTSFNVARSGAAVTAYANNLYVIGGNNNTSYFGDVQYAKINPTTGLVEGGWKYSTSLPNAISDADSIAANGYMYIFGGRSSPTSCSQDTLLAPISANTSIASGNNPTGVGSWYATNQRISGKRYGAAAVYYEGKAYVLGGASCIINASTQVYSTEGLFNYTVPSGVTRIKVKAWGGGGGGGAGAAVNRNGGNGGGGGYATAVLNVNPGETLNLSVGGGGGGGSNNTSGRGGGGGGESGIMRSNTLLIAAGGGGGGGGGRTSSANTGGAGGAGGDINSGIAGSDGRGSAPYPGGGGPGTATSGGAGGAPSGSGNSCVGQIGLYLEGGNGADGRTSGCTTGNTDTAGDGFLTGAGDGGSVINSSRAGGGGGGSGYYGGGGGASSDSSAAAGGGGGGSSFVSGTDTGSAAGSGMDPGNISDPILNGASQGGAGGISSNNGSSGADGLLVIEPLDVSTIAYPNPKVQQTTLLSQPQVAKYSIMIDTDTDVFPNYWLLNGVDNSVGARWHLKYRSMANQQTATRCATMSTWGAETNFGSVSLGTPGQYIVKDGSGANINCGRYYYFNATIDSSQAYGYPDDVARGPTLSDMTLQFTADPAKRLMHGRTFIGGLQMPDDTPLYAR